MKKFFRVSVIVSAALCMAVVPALRAQNVSLQDPAEYNAYKMADSQTDLAAKASAFESYLAAYPNSVLKASVLETLVGAYSSTGNAEKGLTAASRLLQLDANNWTAISYSVFVKKQQCAATQDASTCDDAAALARKGLSMAKPKGYADDEWKKQTAFCYPIYHSTLALSAIVTKKDYKTAIEEYRQELMLFSAEETQSGLGLSDTLHLAEAYAKLKPADMPNAVWFYARAYAYAPANYKPQLARPLEYWYKKFHGGDDGLEEIKAQAAANLFPPNGAPAIKPAKTLAEIAHEVVATTADLKSLNLNDAEIILVNGGKVDVDKLWAALKDQLTPVSGVVLEATATQLKVAVSEDAKSAKTADFIVNMKKPIEARELPAVGFEFKLPPAEALVGVYDAFKQIPASDSAVATAQIVLRDGEILPEEKKKAASPAAHKTVVKPSASHK